MTIMRMYNRNGCGIDTQDPVYRFSDMLRDVMGQENQDNRSYSIPKANTREENDAFILSLAAPGLKKSEITLNLEKDILHVIHKSEEEDSIMNYNRKEFDFRNFERSFRLPEIVDTEKIKAEYHEGVLTITLPKRDEAIDRGPRKIDIS